VDDNPSLRESVRARLADGSLFRLGTLSIARRGSGRACNVCGSTIAKESNELQVDQSAGSYAFVHEDCYRLWREESRR
jgi:hypothetical protein